MRYEDSMKGVADQDVYKRQALYRMLEIKSIIISKMEKTQPRCHLTISEMSIYTKHTEIDKTLC